jgi:hypothetical protein
MLFFATTLITYAMLCYCYIIDHLYFWYKCFYANDTHSLLLPKLHNPCLLYWVRPVEYIRVLTLLDLKFCRYRSSRPWILLCSRPFIGLGVVNDSVFHRYMDVAHLCISYY